MGSFKAFANVMSASLGGSVSRSSFYNCLAQKYLFSGDGSYLCLKFLMTCKASAGFGPRIPLSVIPKRFSLMNQTLSACPSITYLLFCFLRTRTGDCLVVQWLRLHAPSAGDSGSVPDWGTRSHMLQLKISHGATKMEDPRSQVPQLRPSAVR